MCDDASNTVVETPTNPFDDPIQRTKYLIKYIRLRKQRAEGELEKRNALKKQKKDAQATVHNARETMRVNEMESNRCKQRLEDLTLSKHELLITLKSIINRETERKRRREAIEEENRRVAAEQQATLLAQAAAEQQQQNIQQAALEAFLLSNQLKNPHLLNSLGMGNRMGYSNIAQLFNTMQQQQLITNSASSRASTSASPANTQLPQRFHTPFQSTTPTTEQQQQSTRQHQQLQAQQAAAAALQSQQQQQTNQQQAALNALIRQQLLAAAIGQQPQANPDTSVLPNALMQQGVIPSSVAAALHLQQQQQQMPNEMMYQTLLATIKAMNSQSSNQH